MFLTSFFSNKLIQSSKSISNVLKKSYIIFVVYVFMNSRKAIAEAIIGLLWDFTIQRIWIALRRSFLTTRRGELERCFLNQIVFIAFDVKKLLPSSLIFGKFICIFKNSFLFWHPFKSWFFSLVIFVVFHHWPSGAAGFDQFIRFNFNWPFFWPRYRSFSIYLSEFVYLAFISSFCLFFIN